MQRYIYIDVLDLFMSRLLPFMKGCRWVTVYCRRGRERGGEREGERGGRERGRERRGRDQEREKGGKREREGGGWRWNLN